MSTSARGVPSVDQLRSGQDVYVREPQRYIPGCISITGSIQSIEDGRAVVWAYVSMPWRHGGSDSGEWAMVIPLEDLGRRTGTPISRLSGHAGHDGFDEFTRIARSWGYP